jgi:hypothetical protein
MSELINEVLAMQDSLLRANSKLSRENVKSAAQVMELEKQLNDLKRFKSLVQDLEKLQKVS